MKRVVKSGSPGTRQSYMNKTKYNPNRYKQEKDTISHEMEFAMTSLCCRRCCEIIQWKVDYGKYTVQEHPRRCNICNEKKVALAYHRICQTCAEDAVLCAKCQKSPLDQVAPPEHESSGEDLDMADSHKESCRYSFVDVPSEEQELQRLVGLNTRVLQRILRRKKEIEKRESLSELRERERRTVLRKEKVREEQSDSDESL